MQMGDLPMRVLWLCNIMLPMIAEKLGFESSVKEGWITGLLERFIADGNNTNVQLAVAFPANEMLESYHDVFVWNGVQVQFYGFYEDMNTPEIYKPALESRFDGIVNDFKPDIVHIFGTEYPHALAMAKVAKNPKTLLVGMQGVISLCAEEYNAMLPEHVVHHHTFRDLLKGDGILDQQHKFELRGKNEVQILEKAGNVTGRTDFDKGFCEKINPNAEYYVMNETLRPCFYEGKWSLDNYKPHRIFFSQADYPLKGFHFLLKAMPAILKKYPDAEIVVAGNNIIRNGVMGIIKRPSYGKYLLHLSGKYGLRNRIRFLGRLSAEEMKQEYLKCHTYVCASVLENSPNSVGEAMLLGTPVVCANVGGVPSMVTDGLEGLLFEKGSKDGLAEAILKIWDDDGLAQKLGRNARIRAKRTHDGERNFNRLIEIYQAIEGKKE